MAKNENQKLKILYIADILKKCTDSEKGITMPELLQKLEDLGVKAERKSVYDDIFLLREVYGMDIELVKEGKTTQYRLMSRAFELPELRLLVDAVSASKFITRKKSEQLIKKLETLTSSRLAKALNSQIVVSGRIKTMNESIYYNVDAVNEALSLGRKISFNYFEWTEKGEKRLRRNGERYVVSPQTLCWDNENYYLVASENESLRHYRVDKMQAITCLEEKSASAKDFDPALYSGSVFGMYGGQQQMVTLDCDKTIAGAIIDRFGKNTMLMPRENGFSVTVNVQVSPQFFAYLAGFGDLVKITFPQSVAEQYKTHIQNILNLY